MTYDEFILINKSKVRSSPDLMSIYIRLFTEKFGHKPNCAGCTFNSDWVKFINAGKITTNNYVMKTTDRTFELKKYGADIVHYKRDGRTFRSYLNKMSEQFAIDFLTYGTPEQLEERKKLFKKLPKLQVTDVPKDEVQEEKATATELIEQIKEITDIALLNSLADGETRKSVIKAIDKRVKELTDLN